MCMSCTYLKHLRIKKLSHGIRINIQLFPEEGLSCARFKVSEITKTIRQLCMDAAYHLPKDIYEGLKKGRETEESLQ